MNHYSHNKHIFKSQDAVGVNGVEFPPVLHDTNSEQSQWPHQRDSFTKDNAWINNFFVVDDSLLEEANGLRANSTLEDIQNTSPISNGNLSNDEAICTLPSQGSGDLSLQQIKGSTRLHPSSLEFSQQPVATLPPSAGHGETSQLNDSNTSRIAKNLFLAYQQAHLENQSADRKPSMRDAENKTLDSDTSKIAKSLFSAYQQAHLENHSADRNPSMRDAEKKTLDPVFTSLHLHKTTESTNLPIEMLRKSKDPTLLTLTSSPFRVVYANDAYTTFSGQKSIVGQPFFDSFASDDELMKPSFALYPALLQMLENGTPCTVLCRTNQKETGIACSVQAYPVATTNSETNSLRYYAVRFDQLDTAKPTG